MVIIGDSEVKEKRFALIEIPKGIDRFVVLPKEGEKNYIIILDDLIRYCLRVRFVYDKSIEKDTLSYLKEKMNIEDTDSVIPGGRYHNRRDYMGFPSLGREDLLYDKIEPLRVRGLSLEGSLLDQIAQKDFVQ